MNSKLINIVQVHIPKRKKKDGYPFEVKIKKHN